ncbi:unnamed protein product [Hydatigera taeniaeformis]|uniref:HECT domain-containing protein n=1 Tax=Hydatigena taeniaeformis TaxID=6205 RepID=A0A0R3X9D8_HYDTA|nr:unnamed protein product [Hydatigera taeniaeformis]
MPELDVEDWRTNTVYRKYNASSKQVVWFWQVGDRFPFYPCPFHLSTLPHLTLFIHCLFTALLSSSFLISHSR